jgi:hypothetical protein
MWGWHAANTPLTTAAYNRDFSMLGGFLRKRNRTASPAGSDEENSLPDTTAPSKLERMLLSMQETVKEGFVSLERGLTAKLEQALEAERAERKALEARLAAIESQCAELKAARSPVSSPEGLHQPAPAAATTAAPHAPTPTPAAASERTAALRHRRLIVRNMAVPDTNSAEAAKAALQAAITGLPGDVPHINAAKQAVVEFASPRNGLVLVQCTTQVGRDALLRAAQAFTASKGWRLRADLPIVTRQQRQAHNADYQALRDASLLPRWRMGELWYKTSAGTVTQFHYDRDTAAQVIQANTTSDAETPQGPSQGPAAADAPLPSTAVVAHAPPATETAKHTGVASVPVVRVPNSDGDTPAPEGTAASGAGLSVRQDTHMADA